MKAEILRDLHLADAIQALADRELKWDRAIVDILDKGSTREKDGIHEYFMVGDSDIAYYTAGMNTLSIHAEPRSWSPKFLANTRETRRLRVSIYEQMKAAGVEIANHETDLYVPVTEETTAIVNAYEFKGNVTRFTSNIEPHVPWYDIPFAYEPGWPRARS